MDLAPVFVRQDCSGDSVFHISVMLKLDLEAQISALGQGPASWRR